MTSKQRAYLRSMGSGLESTSQIGKGEISESIFKDLDAQLEKHELVKISVLRASPAPAKAVAEILSAGLRAETVAVTGGKILLYRRSKSDKGKHIELPQ